MTILAMASEKGGGGKTTLGVNLAAVRAKQGRKVLLVDADKQNSATHWAALRISNRYEPMITCVSVYGDALGEQVRALAKDYDDVVIDTRGTDSKEMRAAMLVAHRIVTPVRASQFDIYAMGHMASVVGDLLPFNPRLEAWALLNFATTNARSTETADAIEALQDLPHYKLLNTVVASRVAWRRIASNGACIHELKEPPDKKASDELTQLAEEVWA